MALLQALPKPCLWHARSRKRLPFVTKPIRAATVTRGAPHGDRKRERLAGPNQDGAHQGRGNVAGASFRGVKQSMIRRNSEIVTWCRVSRVAVSRA